MQLVRFALLSYQPPVPPPKVVPLPTSEVGAGHTAPSDAAFVPYHGALPTLEVRACGDRGRGGARGTAGAPSAQSRVWLRTGARRRCRVPGSPVSVSAWFACRRSLGRQCVYAEEGALMPPRCAVATASRALLLPWGTSPACATFVSRRCTRLRTSRRGDYAAVRDIFDAIGDDRGKLGCGIGAALAYIERAVRTGPGVRGAYCSCTRAGDVRAAHEPVRTVTSPAFRLNSGRRLTRDGCHRCRASARMQMA